MSPSFAHRITKYDPADRDEYGRYHGTEDTMSDHGPVEAAYLESVAAFVQESGIDRLEIREPEVTGMINFGLEAPIDGHGLAGLFPPDLAGYYDGAEVSVPVALELVRAMLRDNGAWCRLECGDTFTVHVGYDQYVYVGSEQPCRVAVARTHEVGLFADPITASPYAADLEEPEVTQAADDAFWIRVRTALASSQGLLLEGTYLRNAIRWYRLTEDNLDTVRVALGPRALLTIWPDLAPDVDAVIAGLPQDETVVFVWEASDSTIHHFTVEETDHEQLATLVTDARAACVLSPFEEYPPLFQAALPDSDGVLRARW